MAVALQTGPGRIDLLVRGEGVTTYLYGDERPVPGFTVLNASGSRAVTQADRPEGVSLWLAHGNIDGVAFRTGSEASTSESAETGHIVTAEMTARRGSQTVGFRQTCAWRAADGRSLLTDTRTVRAFPGAGESRVLDLSFWFIPPEGKSVTFGRTDESLLMVRAASTLRPAGGGQVRNSEGDYGAESLHGRAAAWCACVGVVQAETVGFTLLDHPANLGHPQPWIARDDGTLSPSPFAWRTLELPPGQSLFLRYRLIVHRGYVDQGWADARLAEFAHEV